MKKKQIANLIMVAIILVIVAAGVLGVGCIRGWFDSDDGSYAILSKIRGIVNIEREGVSYGVAKRSSFMIYRMTGTDWILLTVMLALLGATIVAACFGQFAATFVPAIDIAPVSWGLAAYTCYLLIPTALHIKEAIQWHISRSKI